MEPSINFEQIVGPMGGIYALGIFTGAAIVWFLASKGRIATKQTVDLKATIAKQSEQITNLQKEIAQIRKDMAPYMAHRDRVVERALREQSKK